MLDELQSWWQSTTPEMQANLQTGGIVVAALLGGFFIGGLVARTLRNRNFDALVRLPGLASAPDPDRDFTATYVIGWMVRLTVWAGAGWWLAHKYGRADIASTVELITKRTWAVAAILVAALALGSLLARRLMDCLDMHPRSAPESFPGRNGAAATTVAPTTHRGMAGMVGAAAYILVALLVLLIAADLFDWPLTRTSALALWQFAQHILVAGAAMVIGCLGARWARELATSGGNASAEQRAGQYTALGIMAGTTVLAVSVLLSSAGLLIGLAALAVLGLLLWLVRDHLPDVTAGFQLRAHKVREVWFEGTPWQVTDIGLVATSVCRNGEICRVQNRAALQARMQGAPTDAVLR